MMDQRKPLVVLALVVVAMTGTASWFAIRFMRPPDVIASPQDGIPPIPDLTRWPSEFRERLEKASQESLQSRSPVKPLTELAELYLANNFTAEAERVLRTLRRLDPRNARTAYFLGRIALRNENLPEAESLFVETTELQPDYDPAWLQLGNIRMRDNRFDEARTCFERRLALVPNDPEASYALAVLERSRGAIAAAIERLEAFLLIHPRLHEQRLMLAETYENAGDVDRAAFHRRLLGYAAPSQTADDPWMDEVHEESYDPTQLYLNGLRSVGSGSLEKARRLLEKAVRLSPDDEDALGALAQTYLGLGRADDARSMLERALTRLPGSDALYARLAEAMVAQSRSQDAINLLERRLTTSPQNPELHQALGRASTHAGQTEKAIAAFREAIRLAPVSTEAHLELGRSLLDAGRRAEAKEQIARAWAMRPDDRDTLLLLAGLEVQSGDLDDAEKHAETLHALGPDEPTLRQLYALVKFKKGNIAAQNGRNDDAAELYRRGLEADPTFGPIYGAQGMLLAKSGNFLAAMTEFKRFAELAPMDPTPYLLIGSAHAQAGRTSEARKAYEQGLAIAQKTGDRAKSAQFERLLAP